VERELSRLQEAISPIHDSYGHDLLHLTVAKEYLLMLIINDGVARSESIEAQQHWSSGAREWCENYSVVLPEGVSFDLNQIRMCCIPIWQTGPLDVSPTFRGKLKYRFEWESGLISYFQKLLRLARPVISLPRELLFLATIWVHDGVT
jgi:hypothetical protein